MLDDVTLCTRERRMVAGQLETYIHHSQCLAGEFQWRAQETEEHR